MSESLGKETARIPERYHGGLERWVDHGIEPGHFLRAVLKNDLKEALARSDEPTTSNMAIIVTWLYNHSPRGCWGSPEHYEKWRDGGGAKKILGFCVVPNGGID